jgi:hypothetical protein
MLTHDKHPQDLLDATSFAIQSPKVEIKVTLSLTKPKPLCLIKPRCYFLRHSVA